MTRPGQVQLVAEAARLGLTIVTNPGSNMRLGNGAPPVAKLLDAGVRLALGTDNCALDDNEDYLSELRLGRLLARTAAATNAEQLQAIFAAGSETGVQAAFLSETGRIEPGYKADLIALDLSNIRGAYLDPEMALREAIMARGTGRDVIMTMVGGRVLYRDGQLTEAVMGEARRLAENTAAGTRLTAADREAASELAEALRRFYRSDAA